MPRTEEQFEEIRQEKRQLILDTALELFAENGFHTTSVSQIAKKAGVSKGLLYNYFESKEHLLKEIIDVGFNELFDIFDPNKDGILEIDEMRFYIETTFDLLKKNTEFWRFYFRVSLQADVFPVLRSRLEKMMEPMMKILVDYFSKQGSEEPIIEAMLFGALMDGIAMDYVFAPDMIPIDKIKETIIKKYCK